jgi:ubiquinone/menaquinone biosynthesis C-methylase UbiE
LQDALATYKDSDLLLQLLDPKRDDVILDVGGGTGRISEIIAKKSDEVFCLEPSSEKVEFAQRARPEVKSFVATVEVIPFPDNYFDKVVVIMAFHHFQDQDKAIDEMKKVMRPNGRIVIQEIDPATRRGRFLRFFETKIMRLGSKFYGPVELKSKLEAHELSAQINKEANRGYFVVAQNKQAT